MKKLLLSVLIACVCYYGAPKVEAVTGTGANTAEQDFIRVVINNQLTHQEIAEEFTFDCDADLINQIYKINSTAAGTTATGNTTGNILKGYYSGAIAGNSELVGGGTWVKFTGSLPSGGKSSIHTFHVHGDTTTKIDRGLSMFGSTTDGPTTNFYLATGDNTYLMELVAGTEGGFVASSLKDSDGNDIKCDAYLPILVAGTVYYLSLYDTLN